MGQKMTVCKYKPQQCDECNEMFYIMLYMYMYSE